MALTDGLISYWKMDDSGGDMIDAHGSNDGDVTGCTQGNTGKINTGYNFDGNDKVRVTPLDADAFTEYSWCVWINSASTSNIILTHGEDASYGYRSLQWTSNEMKAQVADGSSVTAVSAGNIGTGTWEFIVVTCKENDYLRIWHNGVEIDNTAFGTFGNPDSVFRVGVAYSEAGEFFVGNLDEIGYWDRVLVESEILELYNSGDGLTYPFAPSGTNTQINIGDTFKDVSEMKINIGDSWKAVAEVKQNIGDTWKTVF